VVKTGRSGANDEIRVLVVDDDIDAANSLAYLLQLLGCKTAITPGDVGGPDGRAVPAKSLPFSTCACSVSTAVKASR
jgi:hypothetical protein